MSDEAEPIQPDDTPSRLAEFARQTWDLVDRALRTPAELWSSGSGAVRLVPSIDSKFQLDRVVLGTETVPPEIHILFRWAGEQTLFGVRELVEQDDAVTPVLNATYAEESAAVIMDSLEENLLAVGYGIKNAIREPQNDVTWLRWDPRHRPRSPCHGSS